MSGDAASYGSLQRHISGRDPDLWAARGRLLLLLAAVASLLFALVTFIAHNWVYLSTVGKLAGIAGLLILFTGLWIWKGFGTLWGQIFGVTAQLLIGIWLAAAGQLYQAPGGLADLLEIWALLGLAFALASRSPAHQALWLIVLFGATAGMQGAFAERWLGNDFGTAHAVLPALLFAVLLGLAAWQRQAQSILTLLSIGFVILALISMTYGVFETGAFLAFLVAAILTLGTGYAAYRKRIGLAPLSLLSVAVLAVAVIPLTRLVAELNDPYPIFFSLALIFGGATYALARLFSHLRSLFAFRTSRSDDVEGDPDSQSDQPDSPWYMDALIAVGGALSALFGTAFLGSTLSMMLSMAFGVGVALMIIGVPLYCGALFARTRTSGLFLDYLWGTLVLVGIGCCTFGMADLTGSGSIWPAALVALCLSTITLWLVPSRVMHFVLSLVIGVTLMILCEDFLSDQYTRYGVEAAIFASLALAGLIALWASRGSRNFLATTVILFGMSALVLEFSWGTGVTMSGWADLQDAISRVGLWTFLSGGAVVALKFSPLGRNLPGWGLLAVLSVMAGLLPVGAGGALLLLLTGYALGSRSVFGAGGVIALAYLVKAYSDLGFTLMELSLTAAVCGLVLLTLWHWSRRRVLS